MYQFDLKILIQILTDILYYSKIEFNINCKI